MRTPPRRFGQIGLAGSGYSLTMSRLCAPTPPLWADSASGGGDGDMSSQSRRLRNGLISLAIFFALVAALLFAVPGLRSAGELITDADIPWVAAGIGFELLSCAGYVILFELVFKMERGFSRRLALSELGVNSVVSAGGIGGIALGAWVLRTKGVAVDRIARRSVLIFVLTSAVNVGATALIGIPMWLGLLPGSEDPLLTLLPAGLAIATIAGTLAIAGLAGRLATRKRLSSGRLHVALVAVSDGVRGALRVIARHDWRLLGAVGYWLFDTLVLYACLLAYGQSPRSGSWRWPISSASWRTRSRYRRALWLSKEG